MREKKGEAFVKLDRLVWQKKEKIKKSIVSVNLSYSLDRQ
jgi:hypothetical protein